MRLLARVPYDTIFSTAYAFLKINLGLVAATLPLILAFAFSGEPLAAWPFFVALSALLGPAVAGAFGSFAAASGGESGASSFWRSYRTRFGRSLAIGAVAALAVIVLASDFRLALGTPFGAVTPMLALLIVLVVVTATALLTLDIRPTLRLIVTAAYLSVRKWYLSLANLAVLGILGGAVVTKPAIGLFLLPGPALYVVWANTRHIVAALRTD
ncbi:MAG: DUF624 domain-containing protein [Hamadaea sp.]|uniref:DUF624 domain-containing protein n=1 Tax=Hamadaea sp. TaxID=2024425 RepID=UPI00183B6C0D|nr:DUF624 domain-containing protein [Hamadaea sp.]NUR73714.1 DUF624 domain-containing protein [Hamadaea sp.]NUT22564.1 DUF624 domain-containing protein [Hamadaea sp.]